MSALGAALQQFEATEANLTKLEALWDRIRALIPNSIAFGSPPEYDELCLAFRQNLPALPAVDGAKLTDALHGYDEIGQMRFDAMELGDLEPKVAVEGAIEEQGRLLKDYRFKFLSKRRALVRQRTLELVDRVDEVMRLMRPGTEPGGGTERSGDRAHWDGLKEAISEIDTLLGRLGGAYAVASLASDG
jgi:hypothetical protein